MNHKLVNIENFEITKPFCIKIIFSDKRVQEIDFTPVLKGEVYGALADRNVFEKVSIDKETKILVWPNGADFDPALLYDWDKYKDELIERAKSW